MYVLCCKRAIKLPNSMYQRQKPLRGCIFACTGSSTLLSDFTQDWVHAAASSFNFPWRFYIKHWSQSKAMPRFYTFPDSWRFTKVVLLKCLALSRRIICFHAHGAVCHNSTRIFILALDCSRPLLPHAEKPVNSHPIKLKPLCRNL
jgi:hypothetical protein